MKSICDMTPFELHLWMHHRLAADDVEPTSTPGYWQTKAPCAGWAGGCRAPMHTYLWNDAPTRHTIAYRDSARGSGGKWSSPFQTWRAAREAIAAADGVSRADGVRYAVPNVEGA